MSSLLEPDALLILAATLLGSAVSAAFAFGGMFLLLAVMTAVMPLSAVIPVQSAILLGSTVSRAWLFRRHIHWPIVWPFSAGSLIGALAGAHVYLSLPEALVAIIIATLMLVAAWAPPMNFRINIPQPYFLLGIAHAFLSAVSSFGGLLQPLLMRSSLDRMAITGTLGGAMFAMSIFKIGSFAVLGFDYRPYLPLIVAGWVVAIPGAWLGQHVLNRMSEDFFRKAFRVLLTVFALRLLYGLL